MMDRNRAKGQKQMMDRSGQMMESDSCRMKGQLKEAKKVGGTESVMMER